MGGRLCLREVDAGADADVTGKGSAILTLYADMGLAVALATRQDDAFRFLVAAASCHECWWQYALFRSQQ